MPEAQDTVPRTGGADARAREPLRSLARALFDRVDTYFDAAFGARANPWRLLGALAWYLFWIVAATGIYVYAAFDTSAAGAYPSVERITANAWPLSGLAQPASGCTRRWSANTRILFRRKGRSARPRHH